MGATITDIAKMKQSYQITVTQRIAEENGKTVSKKNTFTVFSEDFLTLGKCSVGDVLDDEGLALLQAAAKKRDACHTALRILSHGDNSAAALYRKLRVRDISEADASFALRFVRGEGWLDEEKQLRATLPRLAEQKLLGPRRLLAACVQKGYRAETVRGVLHALVEEGTIDFSSIKRLLFKKYHPASEEEWALCLSKHGFSTD